ncbi:preprotein translocase subunit SecA [Rhizobium leguminosarum]|uniref:preprotein translocase subunit SecA n=1 Tax=Rhizobium leguminosarum TaxID=384 RepID=UPI002E147460|nr:preprotein translocase subunit SecA [Rhizobium leguminosarum]WSH76851.1 preprotein translocase subunit SecA [Rhizobium leguminosarum]
MFKKMLRAIGIGSVRRDYKKIVRRINEAEPSMQALDDEGLKSVTWRLQDVLAVNPEFTDDVVVEAFAAAREAARRVLGQRPYNVQLLAGLVLHDGKIAEMRTGEGKTLVALMPTYLNALLGKGVHVVTVNDYLARRDASIIGRVHRFLGLTVGVLQSGMPDDIKREAYRCDVTYGTNSEVGFDYLRDNLRFDASQLVQRGHHFAIIDEVDSVLIDEARTPLIISGPLGEDPEIYKVADGVVRSLSKTDDLVADLKARTVVLTEAGTQKVETLLRKAGHLGDDENLYDAGNAHLVHHVNAALKAHTLFVIDRDYVIKDGEIVIVDQSTGRMQDGRRFNDSIHQAIEAKEGVEIKAETQTLTSITYQNLFRMYGKLSGMTGTAMTEAEEFLDIYKLAVESIPTHRPVIRIDEDDEVHLSTASKHQAILFALGEAKAKGQPVLIGTPSVEKSEALAAFLKQNGYLEKEFSEMVEGEKVFQMLNARNHEREAEIVAQAGMPGVVTIATNMAGRGTDIQLGGSAEHRIATKLADMEEGPLRTAHEEAIRLSVEIARDRVRKAGGLFVIGTERHESRRIDNQLRGRSGRQGDPGRSLFYVSLEDDLVSIYAPKTLMNTINKMNLKEGEALRHPMITRILEKSQAQVENVYFEMRKEVLKFDDVNNQQRKAIHEYRQEIMGTQDVDELVSDMREQAIHRMLQNRIPAKSYAEQWDVAGLSADVTDKLNLSLPISDWVKEEGIDETHLFEVICQVVERHITAVRSQFQPGLYEYAQKRVLLETFDRVWRTHLAELESLKNVVNLRTVAQRDPVVEYRTDAYAMFENMVTTLEDDVTKYVTAIRPKPVIAAAA